VKMVRYVPATLLKQVSGAVNMELATGVMGVTVRGVTSGPDVVRTHFYKQVGNICGECRRAPPGVGEARR